jgi:hypothetical protein
VVGSQAVSVGDYVTRGQLVGLPDNTGSSSGDHLHIDVKVELAEKTLYADPFILMQGWWPGEEPEDFSVRGIHDVEGRHIFGNAGGLVVVPFYVVDWMDSDEQRAQEIIDTLNAQMGEYPNNTYVIRLSYHYGQHDGGQGGWPPEEREQQFLEACISLSFLINAQYFILGNELNNPSESTWITPHRYTQAYNLVWNNFNQFARLSPMAIDPFNAERPEWGDWRVSWRSVLDNIDGAEFLAFHTYDHGINADPGKVFGDPPLQGVNYNLEVLDSQTEILPPHLAGLQRFVTETGHTADGSSWSNESAAWVLNRANPFFRMRRIRAAYYRFNYGDPQFRIAYHGDVLGAIVSG